MSDSESKSLYTVTLLPMQIQFDVRAGESVLDGALRQCVRLPWRCGVGSCGACLSRLVEGKAHYPKLEPMLTDKEKAQGLQLICQLHPQSDLVIELI